MHYIVLTRLVYITKECLSSHNGDKKHDCSIDIVCKTSLLLRALLLRNLLTSYVFLLQESLFHTNIFCSKQRFEKRLHHLLLEELKYDDFLYFSPKRLYINLNCRYLQLHAITQLHCYVTRRRLNVNRTVRK